MPSIRSSSIIYRVDHGIGRGLTNVVRCHKLLNLKKKWGDFWHVGVYYEVNGTAYVMEE